MRDDLQTTITLDSGRYRVELAYWPAEPEVGIRCASWEITSLTRVGSDDEIELVDLAAAEEAATGERLSEDAAYDRVVDLALAARPDDGWPADADPPSPELTDADLEALAREFAATGVAA